MEIRRKVHRLHAGQRALRDAARAHRYVTAALGRRWGKTYFGTRLLAEEACTAGSRYRGLWAAPTYDLVRVAWDEWHELMPGEVFDSNQSNHEIALRNGARLFFRTTENPNAAIGRGYDRAVIDEAARVRTDALKRAILPALADRNGALLALTTPWGRRNWAYEFYTRGLDETFPEWASVNGSTLDNPNPAIREWVHQMAPESMGGMGGMPETIYRQEILGEFLEDAASVFRNVRAAVLPKAKVMPWSAAKGKIRCIGIDIARVENYTVLSGLVQTKAHRELRCFERFHRIDWQLQRRRIKAAWEAAGKPLVVLDSTGVGDVFYDNLRADGVRVYGYKFTHETKRRLIDGLQTSIEAGHLRYPDIPVLISELEAYGYEIGPLGAMKYGPVEGQHDDCVDSLALAEWGSKMSASAGKTMRVRLG